MTFEAVYCGYYARLCRLLRADYPAADPDHIHDAVTDALVAFWRQRERYDPTKSSLMHYLLLIARRALFNLWRAERPSVPLDPSLAVAGCIAEHVLSELAAADLRCIAWQAARDPAERAIVSCWLRGERATEQTTGLSRRERDQARDGLTRRLRRLSDITASEGRSAPRASPGAQASHQPDRRAA
jgi:DNA-directed RNA polymerase specialized sigma24 family protein